MKETRASAPESFHLMMIRHLSAKSALVIVLRDPGYCVPNYVVEEHLARTCLSERMQRRTSQGDRELVKLRKT
jgi:hypothetical protein